MFDRPQTTTQCFKTYNRLTQSLRQTTQRPSDFSTQPSPPPPLSILPTIPLSKYTLTLHLQAIRPIFKRILQQPFVRILNYLRQRPSLQLPSPIQHAASFAQVNSLIETLGIKPLGNDIPIRDPRNPVNHA